MFLYVRFLGEYFEVKRYDSIQRIIEVSIRDIKTKRALPCSVIDAEGNVLYNKKELIRAIEEYCLRVGVDCEFYAHLHPFVRL